MKRAFSLIELSIVILIIGILVAGVTQGSRLVAQFRLTNARTQTQNAPMTSMLNMALWFESTSTQSIADAETENGLTVSTWYDINPTSTYKYNATQGTSGSRPLYTTNCINSLPCLRFDGVDDFLLYDGTFLSGSDYTIVVVEQRRDGKTFNYFLGGSDALVNANLTLGYSYDANRILFSQYGNDLEIDVADYTSPIPRIHLFRFNSTSGKTSYQNSLTASTLIGSASPTVSLISYNGAAIGRYIPDSAFYNGDISEIIIFTRALKTEEINSIMTYLSKKWGIVLI